MTKEKKKHSYTALPPLNPYHIASPSSRRVPFLRAVVLRVSKQFPEELAPTIRGVDHVVACIIAGVVRRAPGVLIPDVEDALGAEDIAHFGSVGGCFMALIGYAV